MSNVDDRCTKILMKLGNLDTHLNSQLCIQVGKRLVHKEYLRITNDSTTHGNTLSLSTGKSLRLTVKKFLKVEDSCCFSDLFVDLSLRNFTKFQSECHIIIYCHVRIQSVVLEYHCDITVFCLNIVHYFSVDLECSV